MDAYLAIIEYLPAVDRLASFPRIRGGNKFALAQRPWIIDLIYQAYY
jgi:hypothetical protein